MARVVLSRWEWGRSERLPLCCIYCGRVAEGYTVKNSQYRTGGFEEARSAPTGEVVLLGCLFGVFKLLTGGHEPVRVTRLQVHLPVCDRHRRAWLVWSWFRMSLDHESLVLAGVAEEFARAVEGWRARFGGGPAPPSGP